MSQETPVKPFHSKTFDDKTFTFRRPLTSEIDRYLSRAGRASTAAATDFSNELVTGDKQAWAQHLDEKPGAAPVVAQEILEKLGFI